MKFTYRFIVVIAVLFVTVGTVAAASLFTSTEQKAAEASPPARSDVTVTVESGSIKDTVPLTCETVYRSTTALKASGAPPLVLTRTTVKDGEELTDGSLLAEINGRPLFALIGDFPLYRSLAKGDKGPDAVMVNAALVRLELMAPPAPDVAAVLHQDAVDSVAELYRRAGYEPPAKGKPVVSATDFLVVPKGATVAGAPRTPGSLTGPFATVAMGGAVVECSGVNGKLPTEAKSGQKATTSLSGSGEWPVTVVAAAQEQTTPLGSSSTGGQPGPGAGGAANGTNPSAGGQAGSPADAATAGSGRLQLAATSVGKVGQRGTGTLVLGSSAPDQLVVPSAALWSKDSRTVVTVLEGDARRDVPVEIVYSADGRNAVKAVEPSGLRRGDQVLVSEPGA
ncbi:hypothetical protein BKD30_02620 [Tersicoccus phoenicis]|uniref:Uncharacterized protein n=1 Tax=Tersicoccus phoenicis TaxID=554083 RepID=A0A1R1LJ76_9MICC|nr:hypothetical protein [Tersicoccus phoenicis]OMH27569.1 hypothetical protein BKD30_02620 [Tersicoccus phoenicis]